MGFRSIPTYEEAPPTHLPNDILWPLPHVYGGIGSTLGMSRSEYGSNGTYTADKSGVRWNCKGWIITGFYDSEGHCDEIVYEPSGDVPLISVNLQS